MHVKNPVVHVRVWWITETIATTKQVYNATAVHIQVRGYVGKAVQHNIHMCVTETESYSGKQFSTVSHLC